MGKGYSIHIWMQYLQRRYRTHITLLRGRNFALTSRTIVHSRLSHHGEGLFALKDSCFCIPMIHGALDITVFTARGKMPREVKGQHVAQIPAVL